MFVFLFFALFTHHNMANFIRTVLYFKRSICGCFHAWQSIKLSSKAISKIYKKLYPDKFVDLYRSMINLVSFLFYTIEYNFSFKNCWKLRFKKIREICCQIGRWEIRPISESLSFKSRASERMHLSRPI